MTRSKIIGIAALLALGLLVAVAGAQSLGETFLVNAISHDGLPKTMKEALKTGDWYNISNGCLPGRGFALARSRDGPTGRHPVTLYFSPKGQINGFAVRLNKGVPMSLQAFWEWPRVSQCTDGPCYDLPVMFRDSSVACSMTTQAATLGDRLVVGGAKPMSIPLTGTAAVQKGWVRGNCISGMGTHHAYDIAAPGRQTWNASTLVPILPMFDSDTGSMNAVLIAAPNLNMVWPIGTWEGPFPNMLMCKNWCANTGCTFPGVTVWTTMHFFFTDPKAINCNAAKCRLFG